MSTTPLQVSAQIRPCFGFCTTNIRRHAKRAATEAITDEATGEITQVLKKKRKTAATPQRLYEKVCKQIEAVRQKKYQSYYGSKNHASAVFGLMATLIQEEVLDNKEIMTNDPILALELAKAPFQALYDLWSTMERPGYGSYEYGLSLSSLDTVLVEIKTHLSTEQIEELVCLLESLEA
jgi:membrane-associated HD superfamily phosphohydrolase